MKRDRWLPPIPWAFLVVFPASTPLIAVLLEATVGMNFLGMMAIAFLVALLCECLHMVIRRRLHRYLENGKRG